jgi:hypothetical protein
MAEIQIVYRHYFCDCIEFEDEFIDQCLTGAARDYGCKGFSNGGITSDEEGRLIIPFGDCVHAQWDYRYKGWVGKRYEMEEIKDAYNPHLDCMRVRLGKTEYDCDKVTLNGECIYNNGEAEMEEQEPIIKKG